MDTLAGPMSSMTGPAVRNVTVWSPNVSVLELPTVAAAVLVVVAEPAGVVAVGEATADSAERAEKEPQSGPAWHPGRPSLSVQGG
jgi:hypothetical protein